jgi:hypothetical protein
MSSFSQGPRLPISSFWTQFHRVQNLCIFFIWAYPPRPAHRGFSNPSHPRGSPQAPKPCQPPASVQNPATILKTKHIKNPANLQLSFVRFVTINAVTKSTSPASRRAFAFNPVRSQPCPHPVQPAIPLSRYACHSDPDPEHREGECGRIPLLPPPHYAVILL